MNKIILIDDNCQNQRAAYGASYIDGGEFESCLVHLEELNEASDFSFLDNAACVMLHDSLTDNVDGTFIVGSRMAREIILNKIIERNIPYVLFSDGHSIIGDWTPDNKNAVKSIKKSEFYRNLKAFLDLYKVSGIIDLRLIAFGANSDKRETVYIIHQLIDDLDNYKDKDLVSLEILDEVLYLRFFELAKNVATSSYAKVCQMVSEHKLTVSNLRIYLNLLASRAIRYTGIAPKYKILALGDVKTRERLSGIENIEFADLASFQLGEKGERDMFNHILKNVPNDTDAIVIDVDSTDNPDSCLAYALGVRLSLHSKGKAALAPIVFMSSVTSDIFKGSQYSSLLMTKGVSFENPSFVKTAILQIEPLSQNDYCSGFLDFVKVKPNATEGRHSIANQWGADTLSRIIGLEPTDVISVKNARESLYFRYILALSLDCDKIQNILTGQMPSSVENSIPSTNAAGCRILLIDDEADKGWDDVLKQLFKGAKFECCNGTATDYQALPEQYRKGIEDAVYDLILLDLRMNGLQEEENLNPDDFSGMKILKAIKSYNKGTQVIMLTASNKAWNMKALIDAGADGYYIKESPEYAFSQTYSLSNAKELANSINRCLSNSYLRRIYSKIDQVKTLIEKSNIFEDRTEEILCKINVAFDLIARSDRHKEYCAYAYIQLFLIIEEYVKMPSVFDYTDSDLFLYNGSQRYRILKDKTTKSGIPTYNAKISMDNGHYCIKESKYRNRFIDTNFLVSAMLIFKFGKDNSSALKWTKIYQTRNDAAHPKEYTITIEDFDRIMDFMLYFFDESKAKWRRIEDAFPDVKIEDQLAALQNKFNRK